MLQHNTITALHPTVLRPTEQAPALLPIFGDLLRAHRPAVGQERPFQRLVALAVGHLAAFGRHTITQALTALGLETLDWSAFYRLFSVPRLDYDRLASCLLRETLRETPATQPYCVGVDGVQVPRHSRRMVGTSWLHNPTSPPFRRGIHRAQRFLNLSWLTPRSAAGYSRAIPVRWDPAFPAKAVRPAGLPARTEGAAALDDLAWLRAELDAAGRAAQPILAIGDGQYSGAPVWRSLPARVSLLARCPRNRALYALPTLRAGRGRPRKYGERAPRPDAWLGERSGWQRHTVAVRGRQIPLTYRVEGPYLVKGAPEQPLFLLVVKGVRGQGRHKQRKPAFWLGSAVRDVAGQWVLPLPVAELLAWAWQRWELEVTHRDAKTSFGVGEVQCWSPVSAVLAVQWQVWVYSLLLMTGYRAWGLEPGPVRLLGRWWAGSRRWSFGQLWQGIRHEIWQVGEYRPGCTAIAHDRWENTAWQRIQTAAVLGARRG